MNRESKNVSAIVRQALQAREVRLEALEKVRGCLIANLDTLGQIEEVRPTTEREHQIATWARIEAKAEAYTNATDWLDFID